MYEVSKYIGSGGNADFFRLKKYSHLGVKVRKRKQGETLRLEEEFAKGKVLRKLGISVPRYIGVADVWFPKGFGLIIQQQERRGEIESPDARRIEEFFGENVRVGLIMEIIEDDIQMISKRRINYWYEQEMQKMKIPIAASGGVSY